MRKRRIIGLAKEARWAHSFIFCIHLLGTFFENLFCMLQTMKLNLHHESYQTILMLVHPPTFCLHVLRIFFENPFYILLNISQDLCILPHFVYISIRTFKTQTFKLHPYTQLRFNEYFGNEVQYSLDSLRDFIGKSILYISCNHCRP